MGNRSAILVVIETESQKRSRASLTMIVCLCRARSDRDVARAIDAGAASIADLQRCGIGTDCGSCHGMLRMMLAEAAVAACPECSAAAADDRAAESA
jgi:bacterioferritin-associated ferredoxin